MQGPLPTDRGVHTRRGDPLLGLLLALGAAAMWLAWFLMPDAGTADAAHIFAAVSRQREQVRLSALVQLAACALCVPGILRLSSHRGALQRWGAVALVVGLLGMAADAVYHQAAHRLTAPGLEPQTALAVLTAMQTEDIRSLVPLLLPFFAGVPLWVAGLRAQGAAPRPAAWLAASAFAWLPVGMALARWAALPRRIVALGALALLLSSLAAVGLGLLRRPVETEPETPGR